MKQFTFELAAKKWTKIKSKKEGIDVSIREIINRVWNFNSKWASKFWLFLLLFGMIETAFVYTRVTVNI